MPSRSSVIVFDVNETLSDMAPRANWFAEVGAPGLLARVWFASILRDGFALTATGGKETFGRLARGALEAAFAGVSLNRPIEQAIGHVLTGFSDPNVHSDVPGGVRALREGGLRLVTDVLRDLLRALAMRPWPAGCWHDEDGHARPIVPQYEFADFLELAVGEIWHYGAGAAQVPARMTAMLADLQVAALPRYRPPSPPGTARSPRLTRTLVTRSSLCRALMALILASADPG